LKAEEKRAANSNSFTARGIVADREFFIESGGKTSRIPLTARRTIRSTRIEFLLKAEEKQAANRNSFYSKGNS
jgi:hypothetical protein